MSRSILFSHLEKNSSSSQEKQDARAEEARRRKEAELRRARKKEQMARDPKRKVALRIQNQRSFASLTEADPTIPKAKKDEIPMQKYEAHSLQGAEKIPIVDVLKIQNQCESLNQPFVEHMLEVRERSERLASYGGSHLASTTSAVSTTSLLSHEERVLLARHHRQEQHTDKMLDKMSMMRSQWQYQLPYQLYFESEEVRDRGEAVLLDVSAARNSIVSSSKQQDNKALAKALSQRIGKRLEVNGGRRGCILGALSMLSTLGGRIEDLPTPRTMEKQQQQEAQRAKKKLEAQKELDLALRARVRRRWAIVKAHVKWLALLFSQQKRHRSSDVLYSVLKQMGEWARIKTAMQNIFESVKTIQRGYREFLKSKVKRCGASEKDWNRLEDYYLSQFFKGAAKQVVQAAKEEIGVANKTKAQSKMLTKAKQERQETLNMLEAFVAQGDVAIDWRAYKIPAVVRKTIIHRWYITNLRKWIRAQAHLVASFKESMHNEKELMKFLNTFGVDDKQKRLGTDFGGRGKTAAHSDDKAKTIPWYQMPEELIFKAIALSAQAMEHDELFRDHPANRELQTERTEGLVYNSQVDPNTFAAAVLKATEKPCDLARFGNISQDNQAARGEDDAEGIVPAMAAGPGDTNRKRVSIAKTLPNSGVREIDIDQVFKSFTPRLREITEEQTVEYRRNNGKEEEAAR